MTQPDRIVTLNRLLRTLTRSLPVYLDGTRPWVRPGNERIRSAIAMVASDERMYAERVAEAIFAAGGRPEPGPVPVLFTGWHDLAVDYLLRRVIDYQRCDIEGIRQAVDRLRDAPALRELAEEILGNAVGHLHNLEELAAGKEP